MQSLKKITIAIITRLLLANEETIGINYFRVPVIL